MNENRKFRKGLVYLNAMLAGILEEIKIGFKFAYDKNFIEAKKQISVSLPLPIL